MEIREPTPQKPATQPPSRMDKSVSLSYAKDFAIAGLIPLDRILVFADIFCQYMTDDFSRAQQNFANIMRTTTMGKGA